MARLKKKGGAGGGGGEEGRTMIKLGSGKPYDEYSEVEVTLDIPVVSWGGRWDDGEEEERIRTEK
jgi:hypothetical protein